MDRVLAYWRLGVLCVAGLMLLGATAPPDDDAAELRSYFSGNGFLNRQLYDLAAEEYRSFLADHPSHEKAAVARYGLAVSLFHLGEFEEAQAQLTRLHGETDFPYAVEVTMVLAQCHLARREYPAAAATFDEVLTRHGDHDLADDAAALRAEALYQGGIYNKVVEPCELLLQRWPQSPHRERVELLWGLSDMSLERYGAAADRFEETERRFPEGQYADQVSLLMAQCLHRAESFRRAEDQYRKVIDRASKPYVPDALYGLASLQHRQKEYEESGRLLDELLEQFPDGTLEIPARLLRGRVCFDQTQYDRAMTFLSPVLERGDTLADEAAYWLAKCELRRNNPAAAARRLELAIKRFPESRLAPEMVYDRGVALVRSERPDEALTVLEGFRRAYPTHTLAPDALHLMVLTEHQESRYARSLALCREFDESYPDDHRHAAAVAFVAAENLFLTEAFDDAGDEYRLFLDRFPADEQIDKARYRLGMALYHQNLFEDAQPLLDSVTEGATTAPTFRPALLALGDAAFQQGQWAEAEAYLEDYLAVGLEQTASDDAMLKLGLARQRQQDFAGALEAFDELLRSFPSTTHKLQTQFERGQTLVAADRQDEAIVAFETLLREGATSSFAPHALNHLGAIAVQRGEFLRAAEQYDRVVEFDPRGELAAEAIYQRGQAQMAAERFDAAGRSFATLVSDYPDCDRVPQSAALETVALARQNRYDEALAHIDVVEREYLDGLEPSLQATVRYEKAWCQRGLDRPAEAAATYRGLIDASKDGSLRLFGMLELAELEMDAKRYEQAIEHLRELRDIDKKEALPDELREQAAYQIGVCHYQLEDYEAAATLLEAFLDTYSGSDRFPSASLLCGETLFNLGRHERAIERLQPVIDQHEDHDAYGPSLLRSGECFAVLQNWDASEAAFARYRQRFPDSPLWYQAQFGIGWARDNRGEPQRAIEAYRPIIDRHQGPTAARAQFQVGECLFAQKQYQEAARELLKVDILYAYPQWSAAAIYEAGRCFEEMSNPVDARRQFQQVVEKHAETKWAQLAAERLKSLARTGLPGHSSR